MILFLTMKDKIKLINDEKEPEPLRAKSEKELVSKTDKNESKEKGKAGRPTLLTPELFSKLIKLFEEHFFIAIVAASSDVYRQLIYDWQNDRKDFFDAVAHARDKWIENQFKLLDKYAKDKKTKDWRALKYKLSIADREYNDKKWIREDASSDRKPIIQIVINQRDLISSKGEAIKLIGSGKSEEETVSLNLFNQDKQEKEQKQGKEGKTDKPENAKSKG